MEYNYRNCNNELFSNTSRFIWIIKIIRKINTRITTIRGRSTRAIKNKKSYRRNSI